MTCSFLILMNGYGETMTKPRMKLGKLKASHLLTALGVVAVLGGYGWHLYALFRDSQIHMPQPQIEKLTRDLRLFQKETGGLPNSFIEINKLIWHKKPTPDYGENGRQARTKNYYYFYTRIDNRTCAIWALPTGPRRHYAPSFFLVLSPDWLRVWKGNAIDDAKIEQLPTVPRPDQLASLGMTEQPARIFAKPV